MRQTTKKIENPLEGICNCEDEGEAEWGVAGSDIGETVDTYPALHSWHCKKCGAQGKARKKRLVTKDDREE